MRQRSILNWVLLSLNGMLFVFLLARSLLCQRDRALEPAAMRATARAMAAYEELGISGDIYCAKGPFALVVAKNYPSNPSFDFFHYGLGINLSLDGLLHDKADGETHSVTLGLGNDFWFSVDFSSSGRQPSIGSFMLSRRKNGVHEVLIDYNADGVFDVRQTTHEEENVRGTYVWYGGAWRAVAARSPKDFQQTEYRMQIIDGERVYFDFESGKWMPIAKESVSSAGRVGS